MQKPPIACLLLAWSILALTNLAIAKPSVPSTLPLSKPSTEKILKPTRHFPAVEPGRAKMMPQPRMGAALVPITVNIPSGCFQMGSPEIEEGRGSDETPHRICVKGFKLAKNEVTVAEFKQFVAATRYVSDAERNFEETGCWSYERTAEHRWNWWDWANWQAPVIDLILDDAAPVTCVSYHDVNAYIAWLNKETGQEYRLPTEAEWEYAARAGTVTARYWGNNPDIACGFANVADNTRLGTEKWDVSHRCEDGYFFIANVRALEANKFDLHDMLGNVWEWTCSRYDERYTGLETVCIDKKPGFDDLLSIRGGGWNADADRVRAAARNWSTAWSRQANLGFRLVRVK